MAGGFAEAEEPICIVIDEFTLLGASGLPRAIHSAPSPALYLFLLLPRTHIGGSCPISLRLTMSL